MRITRLAIRDLRRYRDAELELAPGLTVVRGANESGKSTLQRAVELALTRKVTSAAAELDALVPWGADPDARPEIDLSFTYEDEDGGTHAGRLEKAFRGTRGSVRLELDGEVITDPAGADARLAELSGVPTEAFFRSTASVRHHELAGLQRDEAALRDRLQASISGATRGTGRAKKKLDAALHELQARGAKNPGRLKTGEDAIAEVTVRLQAGEDALARLAQDRDTLSAARERRAEAEMALTERRSMLEKARQAERLNAERDQARERFERYRTAVVVRDEIAELEASHPSPTPLPVLRSNVERLRGVTSRIAALRAQLEGEVQVSFEVPPEVKWRPLSRLSIGLVLVGIVIAGVAFGLDTLGILELGTAVIIVGAFVAAVGLALAIVGVFLRRSDRVDRHLRDAEVDRRLRGRSDLELELRTSEAEEADLLGRLGLEDLDSAEDLLRREDEHTGEIDVRRARLSGLIGDEPQDVLPARRDSAALEIEQKTAALEALGPIAKEPRARERLEVEVADAEGIVSRSRDEEAGARARVEQNPVDAEEVAALAERLASWQEELAALRRRERVYAATLREINAAEQATMQRATRYLERHMGPAVTRVTGGRYRRVRVDDADLAIEVFSPERGDWCPVSDLSQGTLDVVYLAARLGLVRLVTGDRRPPLVMDDPFVTLDAERGPRALELLREVAADFQVIYLTTSDRYDAIADRVLVLEPPSAVDEPGEPEDGVPA